MSIEEVVKYRFLVKGLSVQTVEGVQFEPGDEFFTKNGVLRKGYIATNEL